MVLITPQPEAGTTVTLLLGPDKIPMQPARVNEVNGWFCDIAGDLAFASAEFAAVRLDRGEEHWTTSPRWIASFDAGGAVPRSDPGARELRIFS
jgi:hypothetical protein